MWRSSNILFSERQRPVLPFQAAIPRPDWLSVWQDIPRYIPLSYMPNYFDRCKNLKALFRFIDKVNPKYPGLVVSGKQHPHRPQSQGLSIAGDGILKETIPQRFRLVPGLAAVACSSRTHPTPHPPKLFRELYTRLERDTRDKLILQLPFTSRCFSFLISSSSPAVKTLR